jgi:hypothetical protein
MQRRNMRGLFVRGRMGALRRRSGPRMRHEHRCIAQLRRLRHRLSERNADVLRDDARVRDRMHGNGIAVHRDVYRYADGPEQLRRLRSPVRHGNGLRGRLVQMHHDELRRGLLQQCDDVRALRRAEHHELWRRGRHVRWLHCRGPVPQHGVQFRRLLESRQNGRLQRRQRVHHRGYVHERNVRRHPDVLSAAR